MPSPNLASFPHRREAEFSKLRCFPAPPFFPLTLSSRRPHHLHAFCTTLSPLCSFLHESNSTSICSVSRFRRVQSNHKVSLRVLAARLARSSSAFYIINCKTFCSVPPISGITSKHWKSPQTSFYAFQHRSFHSDYHHKYQYG